ncbi:MAG: hypothetical protein QOE93_119 [Actinomycetota bacterium]|jgi:hypothetical protein|nr:hypothetical protein [Actinomycetota bacterium]
MTTRPVLVASIGASDVAVDEGSRLPLCPPFRPSEHAPERPAPGDWGPLLSEFDDERLAFELVLTKLDLVFEQLAPRSPDGIELVLVGTDGNETDYAPSDTIELARVVKRIAARRAAAARLAVRSVRLLPAWGDPNDASGMWEQSGKICDAVAGGPEQTVHLLLGGTPGLRDALRLRFVLAHDLGLIGELRLWTKLESRSTPSDTTASILQEAAIVPRLVELAQGKRFSEIRLLTDKGDVLLKEVRDQVRSLARFGQAVLELDVASALAEDDVPEALRLGLHACRFPSTLAERVSNPGPLADLRPSFRLMLALLDARLQRDEIVGALAVLHLIGEYLPHVVGQAALGHPLDPLRLVEDVFVEGSLWGTDDARCKHHPRARGTAIGLGGAGRADAAFSRYVAQNYSYLGQNVATCFQCEADCRALAGTEARARWEGKVAVVSTYRHTKGFLTLRHTGPGAHFFTVPAAADLSREWNATAGFMAKAASLDPATWKIEDVSQLPAAVGGVASYLLGDELEALPVLDRTSEAIVALLHPRPPMTSGA